MPRITDIQLQKKKSDRVNIFLDGKYAFAVSLESRLVNKLQLNQEILDETINNLIFQDQVERLTNQSLKFLSFRPRSEKEIRDQLLKKLRNSDKSQEEKKHFEKSVGTVIEKLKKLKQLDDQEFANWWVDQKVRFKQISPTIIKSELFAKGIARDLIDKALQKYSISEEDVARTALEKKAKSFSSLETEVQKERATTFLARKGFNWHIIKKVVDSFIDKS